MPVNVIRSGVNTTESFILIYFPKEKQLSAHNEQLKLKELKPTVRMKLSSPKHHPLIKPTSSSIQLLLSAAAELAVASYSCFSADFKIILQLIFWFCHKQQKGCWLVRQHKDQQHISDWSFAKENKKICCSQKNLWQARQVNEISPCGIFSQNVLVISALPQRQF